MFGRCFALSWWWTWGSPDCIHSIPCSNIVESRRWWCVRLHHFWILGLLSLCPTSKSWLDSCRLFGSLRYWRWDRPTMCISFLKSSYSLFSSTYKKWTYLENGQPRSIVKHLLPKRGAISFFKVTPLSFHQVKHAWYLTIRGALYLHIYIATAYQTGRSHERLKLANYHASQPTQVAEVRSSQTRLSVNGWLYGTPVVRPPVYLEPRHVRDIYV